MVRKTPGSITDNVQNEGVKEATDTPLSKDVAFGELLWVKLHGSSWWPSQVVDEKTVSSFNKPSKKSSGEVLVRLYGSYKYLYINCNECCVEFEEVLRENNGSHTEILKKSMEEDLSRIRSGRSKGQGSKLKATNSQGKTFKSTDGPKQCSSRKKLFDSGTPRRVSSRIADAKTQPTKVKNTNLLSGKPENLRSKKTKHGTEKKHEQNIPDAATTSAEASQVLSERKVKVMQSLGLAAPTGSPFRQNGVIPRCPIPI